jgi:hypothetical protein
VLDVLVIDLDKLLAIAALIALDRPQRLAHVAVAVPLDLVRARIPLLPCHELAKPSDLSLADVAEHRRLRPARDADHVRSSSG